MRARAQWWSTERDPNATAVAGDAMAKAAANTSKRDSERGGQHLQTQEV